MTPSQQPGAKPKAKYTNPFNGIERHTILLSLKAYGREPKNPFNGIERKPATPDMDESKLALAVNPFNGIERM